MEPLIVPIQDLTTNAIDIWLSGGWAMIALSVNALVIFAIGMHIVVALQAKRFEAVPERTWRVWLSHPGAREGRIGELIDFVAGGRSIKDSTACFDELRAIEVAPIERDLRLMRICVTAAPLLGLLGTVTGMLSTFGALASGSGGDETMALVASGISEALITTETGLVIALPGLFFHYFLSRRLERTKAFLAHLQTACTQHLVRSLRARGLVT